MGFFHALYGLVFIEMEINVQLLLTVLSGLIHSQQTTGLNKTNTYTGSHAFRYL